MGWQDAPVVGQPQEQRQVQPKWASAPVIDAPAAAAEPVDTRPTGDALDAVIEPVMSLGSSALAAPVAGIAGLGAAGLSSLGIEGIFPGNVVTRIQEALTYQPRTKAGQVATNIVSYPFEKLAQGADFVGQKVSDATGSPAAGAATRTAGEFLPSLLIPALRGRGRRAAPPEQAPAAAAAPEQVTATAGQPEFVAPDLVLEQTTRPVQRPAQQQPAAQPAPVQSTTPEARAQEYARSAGVDWTALPREVQQTLTSVASDARGFEGLDNAAIARQLQLASLPKPVPATRGQLTRDPVQLRNENNVAATKAGEQIRETHLDANQALLDNLDVLKGRVANKTKPAETPEQVGLSVQDAALREKLRLKKAEVKAKYDEAEAAGELQAKVSPARLVQTIRGTPDKTHFGWVESWLKDMEVIQKTDSGTVTNKLSLKELEDLRQAAVARAMNGGTEGFYAGKVIGAIDQMTDGAGGAKYKAARAARREQALEFEETGAIARLVENKSRTDRATALEDTWRKTVVGGSVQDLRNVKRSLLTGGDRATRSAGKRAWRDIKAQTIQHIKDEATKGVATNERGAPNVTPAAMKRAVDSIGKEKLDEIFGAGTAARIYRVLEATRTVKTVPPPAHGGASTFANILSFLERSIGKVPIVGDTVTGTLRAGKQLKDIGESGRLAREAQRTPLQDAEKQAKKRNALSDF